MKLPAMIRDEMRTAIAPLDTPERRDNYRAGRIPRFETVKNLDMRYRWDLLHRAIPATVVCGWYDAHGVNDSHIDTALRSIVPPL